MKMEGRIYYVCKAGVVNSGRKKFTIDHILSPYSMDIYKAAKNLRKNVTKAEAIMWKYLSNRKLNNLKFRSQAVIYRMYIVDFYCPAKKLIIEIDGSIHDKLEVKEYDKHRTETLKWLGYHVIRFSNEEVLLHVEKVLIDILREIEKLGPP